MKGTRGIRSWVGTSLPALLLLAAPVAWAQPTSGPPLPDGYMYAPPARTGLAPKMQVTETSGTAHVFDAIFSPGDEILSGLTDLARKHGITSGYVTGLGGLSGALLGFGDPEIGGFARIAVDEKCELVSLEGHIQMRDGAPFVHLHAIVALKDGSTKAGHVFELRVAPVAEVSLVATSMAAGR
jgi:predicted DNA-binding protein with PD1-like motif